jgi:hypothetical protein
MLPLLLGVLSAGAGCVQIGTNLLVSDVVLRGLPTFEEVRPAWPPLAADRGRIVVYYPRDKGREAGGPDGVSIWLDGKTPSIMGGTFIYGDCPPGSYELRVGLQKDKYVLTLNLVTADTLYVELGPEQKLRDSPFGGRDERPYRPPTATLVSREIALSRLRGLRSNTGNAAGWHLYDEPGSVKKP